METLRKAGKRALGGGVAGAAAMFCQVGALMWMRTTVNFQYAKGMGTLEALRHLYKEGGIPRFYRGVGPALIQGPLSRFGDTASNAGMIALLDSRAEARNTPHTLPLSSLHPFRIFLMPIDACKTILQVEGADGLSKLRAKIQKGGVGVLWHGSIGAMTATFVGHYPWFYTYNFLNAQIPQVDRHARNALLGFCSSAVSDTCSNSIRVIKTTTQTSQVPIGYGQALQQDGISGLLFRGLVTKIISNGCQGLMFSVLWRLGQDAIEARGVRRGRGHERTREDTGGPETRRATSGSRRRPSSPPSERSRSLSPPHSLLRSLPPSLSLSLSLPLSLSLSLSISDSLLSHA
uniref:Mitochondrial carrier protein n=1 Tax=Emiliania huxleyi (strain CCMP1516) TaxID=280463 RepID=A0A0D3KE59_EMIH1